MTLRDVLNSVTYNYHAQPAAKMASLSSFLLMLAAAFVLALTKWYLNSSNMLITVDLILVVGIFLYYEIYFLPTQLRKKYHHEARAFYASRISTPTAKSLQTFILQNREFANLAMACGPLELLSNQDARALCLSAQIRQNDCN